MQKVGLFLFFLFFSLSSYASQSCQKRQFIFLIHGIAGSEATFGYLEDYLESIDLCYEVFSFEYDTGHPVKDTSVFAKDFQDYVSEVFKKHGGQDKDKISLIMHSQGGLVGSLWLRHLKELNHPLLSRVDAFITLSTPFWGANIANLGKKIFYSETDKNPISPFGLAELNEMSFGSKTINNIYQEFHDIFSLPHLRPLAVGGEKKLSSMLTGEDDLAVPIYSSRPDHYRVSLTQSAKRGPASISASQFEKTDFFKFATVKSTHFKFDLPGIASIPFKCLVEIQCKHPAIDYILKHLKDEKLEESSKIFHNFRVQIFLENESRDISSFKDAKLSILDRDGTWISFLEALKKYRGSATNKEGKAFTFSGAYWKKGRRVIKVKVSLKGKFDRILEIPVEGGHTSIVNLHLND